MSSWNYIELGSCLALLGFLLWQEWRRANRVRLLWRCVATLMAVGGLACLGLPICRLDSVAAGGERVLLTEGYDKDSVQVYLRAHPGMGVDTVTINGRLAGIDGEAGVDADVGRWHVFGYGLTKEEWGRLRPAMVEFHPAVSRGVVAVDWQRKLDRGDRLVVQGRWAGGTGKLLLMGMGAVLDSAKVSGPGGFSLGVVPAQIGRAVYRLVVVGGKDTVAREDVPVEVEAGAPLRILMLAASPDFENSFLMKWFSGAGHQAASRTLVSRGKAQESFVNREPVGLAALTPGLLGGFDIVVADVSALPGRGTTEAIVLRKQVEEKGLGLVVKVDSAGLDSMVRVMRGRPGKVLVKDSLGRLVAGSVLEGMGKVIFTSLNTSYSRLLAGDRAGYAGYWATLLRAAARRDDAREEWSWEPALPKVREEVGLRLQTAVQMPRGVAGAPGKENMAVYLAQDAGLPFEWRGKYWPEKEGWNWVNRPMGDTTWWYVWPREAWRDMERLRRVEDTKRYALEKRGSRGAAGAEREAATGERVDRQRVEFPKVWFWGLFLLGVVFLWVERKMGGMNG